MHLAAEAFQSDATVSLGDPWAIVVLGACAIVTVAAVGLLGVIGAAAAGRAD